MSDENPYQSPQADITPVSSVLSPGGLTENMVASLRGTAPWLGFIGTVFFIFCGLVGAGGIVCLIVPVGDMVNDSSLGRVAGLIYLGLAVFTFFPARFIYRFGAGIRAYLRSNTAGDLELAFKNNKSLWKFNGILTIVYLAMLPLLIIAIVVAAVTSYMY